nr:hypothetical protein BaRGS_032665 [Batillaria attramentaria]
MGIGKTLKRLRQSHLGYPLLIHTDQGKNFTSQLFSELCKLLHIIKTRTTPYRPCSNGQVERINRTILQMVRCTLQAKQVDWDRELQVLMGAIRSTENRSTGFTPNFLMLGREVNTPLQLMVGAREGPKGCTADYVASLQASMERAHLLARKNLGQQLQRQKKAYDLRASHTSYEVGDIVSEINSAANEWFHGDCVGVTEEDAKRLDLYCCPVCTANGLFV